MCGLVGVGDYQPRAGLWEHDLFSQLLVADSVRGVHGTGIMKIYQNGASDWRKVAGDPYTLFSRKGIHEFMEDHVKKDVRFIVGHNRSATTGRADTDCAHPFTIGKITLMHNGTLDKFNKIVDFDKFPVDSEAICNSIDKEGIEKTLGDIRGAYTLIYYDSEEKTLNLIRNKERPLYIGIHLERGQVYFASEFGMLRWVLARNNIFSAKIEELPVDHLFTFGMHSIIPKMTDMKEAIRRDSKSFHNYGRYGFESYESTRIWNATKGEWEDREEKSILTPDAFKTKKEIKKEQKKASGNNKNTTALTVVNGGKSDQNFLNMPGTLNQTETLHGYHRGSIVYFRIVDYTIVDKEKETWRIEGVIDTYPDVQLLCYVKWNAVMDILLSAEICRGNVTSMQYNLTHSTNPKAMHRIWIEKPSAIRNKELASVCEECGNEVGSHFMTCSQHVFNKQKVDLCPECNLGKGFHKIECSLYPGMSQMDISDAEEIDVVRELAEEQRNLFPDGLGSDTIN